MIAKNRTNLSEKSRTIAGSARDSASELEVDELDLIEPPKNTNGENQEDIARPTDGDRQPGDLEHVRLIPLQTLEEEEDRYDPGALDERLSVDVHRTIHPTRNATEYDERIAAARAFLEGREFGAAAGIEDEETRALLDQSFSMLSRLREAVEAPDEVLRLPDVEPERRKVLLVRSGRPFGPLPLPSAEQGVRRLLARLRRIPRPEPALPLGKDIVDDVKILAAHRPRIPREDRFAMDVAAHHLLG